MKIPRDVKGEKLVKVLTKFWNYKVIHQRGSHIILQTNNPDRRVCIPNHNPIRVGTLNSIVTSVADHKNVTKQDILKTLS